MVWDVTCPDTLAPELYQSRRHGPGAVATFAEDNKRLKYAEISRTYIFVPIAVETMGAVGEERLTFLKELGARISTLTKERRSFEFLMHRGSVLQSNEEMLLAILEHCLLHEILMIFVIYSFVNLYIWS